MRLRFGLVAPHPSRCLAWFSPAHREPFPSGARGRGVPPLQGGGDFWTAPRVALTLCEQPWADIFCPFRTIELSFIGSCLIRFAPCVFVSIRVVCFSKIFSKRYCAVKWLHVYSQSSNCIIMESRRDVFQAIADPTRRAILTLLAVQALTPGAIADNFKSSRQTISKHIQILTECELVKPEQNGREIYYHINAKQMNEVADFIESFRKLWDDRFNTLEAVMNKYKTKK